MLTIGNVIGMLIALAGYPIITRLYTDVEFGEFSVYQSIFIILISISSLHFNKAIVLTKGRKELNQLIRFVLINPMVDVFDPRRLLAPSLVLAVRPMAYVTQITIGALSEVITKD